MEDNKRYLFALLAVGVIFLLMPYYLEWVGIAPVPPPEPVVEEREKERTPLESEATTPLLQAQTADIRPARGPPAVLGRLHAGGRVAPSAHGGSWRTAVRLTPWRVVAYDGVLKNTPLGPVAMGSCRTLNVLLGMSAAPNAAGASTARHRWP